MLYNMSRKERTIKTLIQEITMYSQLWPRCCLFWTIKKQFFFFYFFHRDHKEETWYWNPLKVCVIYLQSQSKWCELHLPLCGESTINDILWSVDLTFGGILWKCGEQGLAKDCYTFSEPTSPIPYFLFRMIFVLKLLFFLFRKKAFTGCASSPQGSHPCQCHRFWEWCFKC